MTEEPTTFLLTQAEPWEWADDDQRSIFVLRDRIAALAARVDALAARVDALEHPAP